LDLLVSETQDIRVWAAAQGLAVKPRGPIPVAVVEQWRSRQADATSAAAAEETAPVTFGGDSPETRPVHTRPKTWFGERKKKDTPAGTPPRRVSIENIVSYGWGMGAYMLAQNPRLLSMARVMDMQAPVAGIVVNDVAKGTIVDRALQPLARAGEKGEKAGGLLGPPIIVAAITLRPDLYPVLRPVLKLSMMSWLEISEPAMKKAQARAERFSEKFGNVDIDAMIDGLFAPPDGTPSDAEEAAIDRAREQG
jgi:hypothetical protein